MIICYENFKEWDKEWLQGDRHYRNVFLVVLKSETHIVKKYISDKKLKNKISIEVLQISFKEKKKEIVTMIKGKINEKFSKLNFHFIDDNSLSSG